MYSFPWSMLPGCHEFNTCSPWQHEVLWGIGYLLLTLCIGMLCLELYKKFNKRRK